MFLALESLRFNQTFFEVRCLHSRKLFEITREIFIVEIKDNSSNLRVALRLLSSKSIIDIETRRLYFRKLFGITREIFIVEIKNSSFDSQLAFLALFQNQ